MVALLIILAVLAALGGIAAALSGPATPQAALLSLVAGLVPAALLAGFARAIELLERIAERTPEIPGRTESTWVPMMADWRVGSVSVAGGGYHALCQKKGDAPIFLEADGGRRLFQSRAAAHQEAEAFLRRPK